MMISLIAAVAKNGVIGNEGDLPWNLPSDLKKFKEITDNKPIIMGRKTWDSIGRPLPNRDNIIVSRNINLEIEGGIICLSPDKAISIAKIKANERGCEEIMVIGGGYIYQEFMNIADKLYITEVDLEIEGDAYFPKIDQELFKEISREERNKDPEDNAYHSLVIYEKVK
ncbi:MAG: dihydrofolate reductase [Pseudomonadota bacterium]|nr:dihydrofolate reductase [Pseudomonadota bacterium]